MPPKSLPLPQQQEPWPSARRQCWSPKTRVSRSHLASRIRPLSSPPKGCTLHLTNESIRFFFRVAVGVRRMHPTSHIFTLHPEKMTDVIQTLKSQPAVKLQLVKACTSFSLSLVLSKTSDFAGEAVQKAMLDASLAWVSNGLCITT